MQLLKIITASIGILVAVSICVYWSGKGELLVGNRVYLDTVSGRILTIKYIALLPTSRSTNTNAVSYYADLFAGGHAGSWR